MSRNALWADAAGTRSFTYNEYDDLVSDCLTADEEEHLITENRDDFGRSSGFAYSKGGVAAGAEQLGYAADGRLNSAAFLHDGVWKSFGIGYLQGSNLLQTLSMPNGITLTQQFEPQPVATRPLALRKDGTWYTYGWDLTKNICEVFSTTGTIATTYSYTPYGAVTAEGTATQFIQWSSEFHDEELGLVYYNYRHYNPVVGRWMGKDASEFLGTYNRYSYLNDKLFATDWNGLALPAIVIIVPRGLVGAAMDAGARLHNQHS